MLLIHPYQDADGGFEVVAHGEKQVDVVEVYAAAEAMGKVVARVDGGEHLFAVRTEEAIASFAAFGRRTITTQSSDGDGHGQVVAEVTEQFSGDHGTPAGE
jgi:hypothetical protein